MFTSIMIAIYLPIAVQGLDNDDFQIRQKSEAILEKAKFRAVPWLISKMSLVFWNNERCY